MVLFLIVRQRGEIIGKLGESFCDVFSVGYGENEREGVDGARRASRRAPPGGKAQGRGLVPSCGVGVRALPGPRIRTWGTHSFHLGREPKSRSRSFGSAERRSAQDDTARDAAGSARGAQGGARRKKAGTRIWEKGLEKPALSRQTRLARLAVRALPGAGSRSLGRDAFSSGNLSCKTALSSDL